MSFVLLRLAEEPRMSFFQEHPVQAAEESGSLFDVGLGGWTGFYDWLRNDKKQVIGVRFSPFEQAEFLLSLPNLGPWVQIIKGKAMLAFIASSRDYIEDLSGDQAFEEARILKAPSSCYALLLGCSDLSEEEQNGLRSASESPVP